MAKIELRLARSRNTLIPVPIVVSPVYVHPDILLWVPFTDGSMADVSSYNRTPTLTNEGDGIGGDVAAVVPDFFRVDITSASPTSFLTGISYPIRSSLHPTSIPASTPLTFEGFVRWNASANNTDPFFMFQFNGNPSGGVIRRYLGYGNAGKVKYDDSGLGVEAGPTATGVLAPSGTLYHWAWVIPATGDDVQRFYINGVEVLTYTASRSAGYALAADAEFVIDGRTQTNGGAPSRTAIDLGETRVTARNLYPDGTTFTPPTPGNLMAIT